VLPPYHETSVGEHRQLSIHCTAFDLDLAGKLSILMSCRGHCVSREYMSLHHCDHTPYRHLLLQLSLVYICQCKVQQRLSVQTVSKL
jgi:hypothetical protein